MVHCFGEHLWLLPGRLCIFCLAGCVLRQKQRPASCYSKATNLSPGCEPIKGHDLLGIYGGGSQPGQRAGVPWPEVFEDLLLPVNSSQEEQSPGQSAFLRRASLHSNIGPAGKEPVTWSAFKAAVSAQPNLPFPSCYSIPGRTTTVSRGHLWQGTRLKKYMLSPHKPWKSSQQVRPEKYAGKQFSSIHTELYTVYSTII